MRATAVERAMAEGAKPRHEADLSVQLTVVLRGEPDEIAERVEAVRLWLEGRLNGITLAIPGSPRFLVDHVDAFGLREDS